MKFVSAHIEQRIPGLDKITSGNLVNGWVVTASDNVDLVYDDGMLYVRVGKKVFGVPVKYIKYLEGEIDELRQPKKQK